MADNIIEYMTHCRFAHGVYIDENLLGKTIPLSFCHNDKEYSGSILFPLLKSTSEDDGFLHYYIDSPTSFTKFGYSGIENWGEVRCQCKSNGITHILPTIYGVAIIIKCIEEEFSESFSRLVESYASKFFMELMYMHPEAFVDEFDVRGEFVSISAWAPAIDKEKRRPIIVRPGIKVLFAESIDKNKVSFVEFFSIYRDLHKDIRIQYELLSDLIRNEKEHNYRSSVLFGAMIIEITLKEVISDYLENTQCDQKIRRVIEKKMRQGFSALAEIMNDLGLSSQLLPKCKTLTIDVRNRIMHGGYMPTKEDSSNSINNTREILSYYKIPFFE